MPPPFGVSPERRVSSYTRGLTQYLALRWKAEAFRYVLVAIVRGFPASILGVSPSVVVEQLRGASRGCHALMWKAEAFRYVRP
jgi:hypothetical protein